MTNFHYNGCGHRGVPNYIGVWFMGVVMVPEAILEKLEPMREAGAVSNRKSARVKISTEAPPPKSWR